MFPNLLSKSLRSFAKQNIAITSEATVILNPSVLGKPLDTPPRLTVISLKALSFKSTHLFQTTLLVSISNLLPQ